MIYLKKRHQKRGNGLKEVNLLDGLPMGKLAMVNVYGI